MADPERNNNSEVDAVEDAAEGIDTGDGECNESIEPENGEGELTPGVGWIKRSYWLLGRALRVTEKLDAQSALTQPK